jgi:hypothetical protein
MTKSNWIKTVKAHLAKVGHGIEFEIIPAGVGQEESRWYVPVSATRKGEDLPREMTVNIFANVEDELERDKHVTVLLIPAVAETSSA